MHLLGHLFFTVPFIGLIIFLIFQEPALMFFLSIMIWTVCALVWLNECVDDICYGDEYER
jgi:hypothetical protein